MWKKTCTGGSYAATSASMLVEGLEEENKMQQQRIAELEETVKRQQILIDVYRSREAANEKTLDAFPSLIMDASLRVWLNDFVSKIPHRQLWNDALSTNLASCLATSQHPQQPQQQQVEVVVVESPPSSVSSSSSTRSVEKKQEKEEVPQPPAFSGRVVFVKDSRNRKYGSAVVSLLSKFLAKNFPKEDWKVELDDDFSLGDAKKKAFLGIVVEQIHGARLMETNATKNQVESMKEKCTNVVLCLVKSTDKSTTADPAPLLHDYDFSRINDKSYNLFLQGVDEINPTTRHNERILKAFEKELKNLLATCA